VLGEEEESVCSAPVSFPGAHDSSSLRKGEQV